MNLIVTYHYVRPKNSEGVTGITPGELSAQIRAIKTRFRVVSVEEFVGAGGSLDGAALITFDDAVVDQHQHAAGVLAEHGVPAVFFAPMRPIAGVEEIAAFDRSAGAAEVVGSDPRWCTQHLLHALAQELGWRELERRVLEKTGRGMVDAEEMNRLYAYEVPEKRYLKYLMAFALPHREATRALHEVNQRVGLRASEWFCTAAQLRELQAAGHAIGGHGFDHVPYPTLSPARQAADMRMAMSVMSRELGAMGRAMAYPFGRHDQSTRRIASGIGYTWLFDTSERTDAKDVNEKLGITSGKGVAA